MSNSKFPPRGIEPWLWKKIQAKRRKELTAELKTLWQTDHILWAVVQGADTDELLAAKFPTWKPETISRKLARALVNNHIKIWGKRYLPTQERHKVLKRRLSHR